MELIREASGFALRGSRVRCELSIADDLHLVDVDEGQISQVIHNLVINADHAMPDGGIVSISCSNVRIGPAQRTLRLEKGSYVQVSIEDQGVGIPREHLAKIFDPYFTTKQKGSGLGLATTYSIVKKHGGHIAVESELGIGHDIPCIYLPASAESIPSEKPEEPAVQRGKGRILIMDDEADVRETTGNVLKRLGYQVGYAEDGKEAIDLYPKGESDGKGFDLVIMDLTVPGGMGGKETITGLLQDRSGGQGHCFKRLFQRSDHERFQGYGFSGVVTKPYRLRDLSEEVFRVLHEK